jgi:hypothetical protein
LLRGKLTWPGCQRTSFRRPDFQRRIACVGSLFFEQAAAQRKGSFAEVEFEDLTRRL